MKSEHLQHLTNSLKSYNLYLKMFKTYLTHSEAVRCASAKVFKETGYDVIKEFSIPVVDIEADSNKVVCDRIENALKSNPDGLPQSVIRNRIRRVPKDAFHEALRTLEVNEKVIKTVTSNNVNIYTMRPV